MSPPYLPFLGKVFPVDSILHFTPTFLYLQHFLIYKKRSLHQPCIIFMDEVDVIGGRRFSGGTSADREIQRTLMELLNQMDGFDTLRRVKMIMATNRPETLDPALLRPGRSDREIHIDLPNEQARLDILKIHAGPITKHGEIDYEAIVKLSDGFNGADMRNVCTEAGMFAIRADHDFVVQEDFMKAVRNVAGSKKLVSKLDYKPVSFTVRFLMTA
ncbi:26S proteasome regulatory subunit 10B-like [Loxodonta africana]|uniref:26S proteasome regulatory subunit 10B-like n=1 Tax=Loxodonta africana TaxID=9785 RepID=UPI0030CF6F41